jgi:hypothetical protein
MGGWGLFPTSWPYATLRAREFSMIFVRFGISGTKRLPFISDGVGR